MEIIILNGLISLGIGGIVGSVLAAKGITAENSLGKFQKWVIVILIAVAAIVLTLSLIDRKTLSYWLPLILPRFILLMSAYVEDLLFSLGCFILGLLVFLELPGRHSSQRMSQLFMGLVAITFSLAILGYYIVPVAGLVGSEKVVNGVVIQTTEYTCAPASIATLGRLVGKYPQLSEKDVVKLTKTNRFGTSVLDEIKAMEKLGLQPEYYHNLTIEDLIIINKPALLHVLEKEKGNERQFTHAVALLSVNLNDKLVIIGNPLYGRQQKTFEEMGEYWLGEAVFVNYNNH